MINSRWGAQVIDGAGNNNANNPKEKIEIDEPRFKGRLHGNHVRFQQGKHNNEENTGKHVRNQFCHTLKIIQSNKIDVKWLKKDIVKQDFTGSYRSHALPPGWRRCECLKQQDFTGSPHFVRGWQFQLTAYNLHSTVYRLLPTVYSFTIFLRV